MSKRLCIHGHFYQPPREDPWLGSVLPEGSAAPMRNWNQRINRECYAPLAWTRRLDDKGRVMDIVNCYEWISFNFGPTLLKWLERDDPSTYARILEGDAKSLERWGHGNALAQVHHHVILPLASELDRRVEVAWGVADFRARFGRKPEGMWLSETAADTPSLEVLAEQGIRYTVLAPRQAEAVADVGRDNWTGVSERDLDMNRPYLVELPSGRSLAVFFYNGSLSQAVAFERLLENGERFWETLRNGHNGRGLLSLATDGETYGHHFTFGEMALAYVLAQAMIGRDETELTNFGAYLADNPPQKKVRIHEPSSWSCVHGVERWRSDCGCSTGGPPEWNQRWRAPLRAALDLARKAVDEHYFSLGAKLFRDPEETLLEYGHVLAGARTARQFEFRYFAPKLSEEKTRIAWKLLTMQQWSLASFASCAWFFEELSRLEPLNAMTYALRSLELARATGGPDVREKMLAELAKAEANIPGRGTGRDLFLSRVEPRRENPACLAAQAVLILEGEERLNGRSKEARSVEWPGVRVVVTPARKGGLENGKGEISISWKLESGEERHAWEWRDRKEGEPLSGEFVVLGAAGEAQETFAARNLAWNKLQEVALRTIKHASLRNWAERTEAVRRAVQLFLPWRMEQHTQTLAGDWLVFWPALAWTYACDPGLLDDTELPGRRESLVRFLKENGEGHPERVLAGEKVRDCVLDLLDRQPPSWKSVLGVVDRAGEIDLRVDWWPVQNRLWSLGVTDPAAPRPMRDVAERIGIRLK